MITHDVGEAILLADRIVPTTSGPDARSPRSRSPERVHDEFGDGTPSAID